MPELLKAYKQNLEALMKQETISFKEKGLDVDMEAFLSQHDVVYLTPAVNGYDGFPLGNGDLGTMAWTLQDRIHFQINKCNAWDDVSPGHFGVDSEEWIDRHTSLRSCGQLQIIPGLPIFDWMYLKDFEGRLSLVDAQARWLADSPLGKIRCSAFVSSNPKVLVIRYEDELSEPVTRHIELSRWGSRLFDRWYNLIRRDSFLGPEGTKAGYSKDKIWIEQPTRSLKLATVCKLKGVEATPKLYHSRAAGFEIKAEKSSTFTLYLSVVTSEEAKDPLNSAKKIVEKAATEGKERIFKRHKRYWSNFWSKSFVDLSEDYLENLWYINVYQVGSSSRGEYPPYFTNSLWAWNCDIWPWGNFHHWNQQQYTWPIHASGHPELFMPYAKWRLEGLPQAIKDAKEVHNCEGAFYCDVSNRRGYQGITPFRKYLLTPGAQIAMDIWRHYQYTLDKKFLNKYAYPIMREVVRFYLNYLKKEDDGLYHIPKSIPYETFSHPCKDTISDLACIRQLFPVFLKASKELRKEKKLQKIAMDVLDKLPAYTHFKLPKGAVEVAGDISAGTSLIAAGVSLDMGKPAHFWLPDPRPKWKGRQHLAYQIANAQVSPIFPTGLIGLDQKGTKEFEIMGKTACSFNPKAQNGHAIFLIAQARMGLRDLLGQSLKKWPGWYQLFPQGLFCYSSRFGVNAAQHLYPTKTNKVRVIGSKEDYIDLPMAPFAHMSLEAGSIFETTINEMLIQSYSGKIRVFPSIPEKWEGRFKLHAVGGFVVISELSKGEVKYIAIESKLGQPCSVVNPWNKKTKVKVKDITDKIEVISATTTKEFKFNTEKGHIYIIERERQPLSSFKQVKISGKPNQGPKKLGQAILGKPRQF